MRRDGKGLECLVVRVGELVGAVTGVREGTLVAALKGVGEFVEDGGSGGSFGGEGGSGSAGEDDGGKGRDEGGEGGEEEKPTMMQILVWRSEGMGAYMAEELGEKFRIPKGFY